MILPSSAWTPLAMSTATTVAPEPLRASIQVAIETDTEQGIDHDRRSAERGKRRGIGSPHIAVPQGGRARGVAGIVRLGANGMDDDVVAGRAQRRGDDEAITAVVAGSAQHMNLAAA